MSNEKNRMEKHFPVNFNKHSKDFHFTVKDYHILKVCKIVEIEKLELNISIGQVLISAC